MILWDTNPWSNSCDLQWEFICHNKWHSETLEISTPPEIAVGSHFRAQHGPKTALLILPADGEASWSLLPLLENTYSCILLYVRPEIAKKRYTSALITAFTPISQSPSLNWSNNKIKFRFNETNRKRWGVRLVNVKKHLPAKVFLLWYQH